MSEEGAAKRGGFSVLALLASQNHILLHCRSSRLEVFCKTGVLRNLAKFTGKSLRQSLFFNKVAGLTEKQTLAQVLSCQFCQISKNTFSYRTPPMAVSDTGIFENNFLFYGQS